ncbi:MAG: helix-turn-helix domain-containing protein [Candidatus Woesearchaeota archaeon]|nr:helix-turn-helix domain-containing protein [Candidatus Woesearchaeota archaeon]
MLLLQPQEVEVYYILPAIRKELSVEMKKHGKTQKEIADILGVTEAAVSQYMNKKRGNIAIPRELKNEVRKAAKKIIDRQSMIMEIQHVIEFAKKTKLICKLHEKLAPVPKGCDVCFK